MVRLTVSCVLAFLTCARMVCEIYVEPMVTRECRAQVADLLPLLKSEIFIGVWFGKMIFLPGNPWYPVGWRLPEKDMKDLATHLRRVSFPLRLQACLSVVKPSGHAVVDRIRE
jgi:hypothetical protein